MKRYAWNEPVAEVEYETGEMRIRDRSGSSKSPTVRDKEANKKQARQRKISQRRNRK